MCRFLDDMCGVSSKHFGEKEDWIAERATEDRLGASLVQIAQPRGREPKILAFYRILQLGSI